MIHTHCIFLGQNLAYLHNVIPGPCVPYKNSFLIVGGFDEARSERVDRILYFDITENSWTILHTLIAPRDNAAAFLIPENFGKCLLEQSKIYNKCCIYTLPLYSHSAFTYS